jgi:hypothetical protein
MTSKITAPRGGRIGGADNKVSQHSPACFAPQFDKTNPQFIIAVR